MQVITTHINADFDAMASMIAAKKLYPDAQMVFPGSQEGNLREFFVKSTSFIYDFTRIKNINLDDVDFLILVDTRQRSRIGRFEEIVDRPDLRIHIYDHHPDAPDDIKGEKEIVRLVGSTSTILTGLIKERGIKLSPEEATILALGIYEDTGSLTFSSTTEEDFLACAYLRSCGCDLNLVSDLINRELSPEQVYLLDELLRSSKTYNIKGIEITIAEVSSDKYISDFAVLVHKLKDMKNLDVLFALALMEDRIYLIARSRIPEVNVAEIASYFGGGGHANAASATIKGLTLIQAEEKLLKVLQNHISPIQLARQLMSAPVISVSPGTSIEETANLMIHYNINAVPVIDEDEIKGIITRQVIEKAAYHKLQKLPVSDFMTTDFHPVRPDATLMEIQEGLVDRHQRLLPVMEDGKIIGVITRRDLLDYLVQDGDQLPDPVYDQETIKSQKGSVKNIQNIMKEQLPRDIIDLFKELGEVAENLKYKAYVVGGFVRDLLLRKPNLDIDIVIEGDGIKFAKAFSKKHPETKIRCHQKFNTAVIVFPDGFKIDVATARLEYYEYPAALPTVKVSSLKLDLYRRDFTINTLAIGINPDNFGQLIDFFGGQKDLKEKVIRVLHNLSFVEDPTRILRAIRFEQRFGFKIGKQTESLIRAAVKSHFMEKVEGRRLFLELKNILEEENALAALRRMNEFNLFPELFPALKYDSAKEELLERIEEVLNWYRLSYFEHKVEQWLVYFMGIAFDLSEKDLLKFTKRLELPEKKIDFLVNARARTHQVLMRFSRTKKMLPSEIYHTLEQCTIEELLYMMAKTNRDESKKAISLYLLKLRNVKPILTGHDLKALNIEPGPIYKEILRNLLDARLNGEIQTKEDEIAFVQKHFITKGARMASTRRA